MERDRGQVEWPPLSTQGVSGYKAGEIMSKGLFNDLQEKRCIPCLKALINAVNENVILGLFNNLMVF